MSGRRSNVDWMHIAVDALAELSRRDDFVAVDELADDLGHDVADVRDAVRRAFLADAAPRRPIEMFVELDGPPGWDERDGAWTRLRLGPNLPFPVRPMTLPEIHLLLLAARFVLDNDEVRDGFGEHAGPLAEAAETLARLVAPDAPTSAVRVDLARTPAIAELQQRVGAAVAFRYRRRFLDDDTPVEWKRHEVWVDSIRFDHGRWYVESRALDTGKRLTFRGELVDDVEQLTASEPPTLETEPEPIDGTLVVLRAVTDDEDELLRAGGAVVERSDGRLRVELRFYPPLEERLAHLLLGLDSRTEVLEPAELRDLPQSAVAEILAQYAGG